MGIRRNRIVVKVGTSTLTNENGQSNLREMEKLSRTLADIQNLGNEVVLDIIHSQWRSYIEKEKRWEFLLWLSGKERKEYP